VYKYVSRNTIIVSTNSNTIWRHYDKIPKKNFQGIRAIKTRKLFEKQAYYWCISIRKSHPWFRKKTTEGVHMKKVAEYFEFLLETLQEYRTTYASKNWY